MMKAHYQYEIGRRGAYFNRFKLDPKELALVLPDLTYDSNMTLTLGNRTVHVMYLGAGQNRYLGAVGTENCALCHGKKGDGKGVLANQYDPPPRNFACAKTVVGVPDGQLFWIIRFGSPDTAMPPHAKLSDEQIWQLVLHLRQLAK